MDFTFTEEQEAVRDLAAQIFAGHSSPSRVKEVEAGDEIAAAKAIFSGPLR